MTKGHYQPFPVSEENISEVTLKQKQLENCILAIDVSS